MKVRSLVRLPVVGAGIVSVILAISTALLLGVLEMDTRSDTALALEIIRDVAATSVAADLEREVELVRVLANEVRIRAQVALLVGDDLEARGPALTRLRELIGPAIEGLKYDGFFVIDHNNVSVGSMRDENLNTINILTRQPDFLRRVRAGEALNSLPMPAEVATTLDQRALNGGPTMFFGAPVYDDDGACIAVLTFRIHPRQHLANIFQSTQFGMTGETYLFGADGVMLTESRFEEQARELGLVDAQGGAPTGVTLRDPGGDLTAGFTPALPRSSQPITLMVASALESGAGVNVEGYRDYRGVPVFGAWTWLPEYNLGVATELVRSEALANTWVLRLSLWAVWFFTSLLVFGTALFLSRARRDLEAFNRTLESRVTERTREAEEASAAKSEFLARMSHEIRTPLNAVLGMAHLARRDNRDPNIRRQLGRIEESGNSLLSLINDILDFSKIEAGALVLEDTPFDLDRLLRELLGLESTGHAGVEFVFDISPAVPMWVQGDPTRLRQVLVNLLGNAFKFTQSGSVTLEVRALGFAEGFVELAFSVVDTGIGIDTRQAESLFSAFQQADGTTTRAFGGTGLGLPISRRIAEAMGGTVEAFGTPGVGSTFRLTARFGVVEREPWGADVLERLKGIRALLVDDSPVWRTILREAAESFGMEVTVVGSGEEAVALLKTEDHRFDIALVDWIMPGMDGLETCARMRELDGAALVIMVTSANRTRLSQAAGKSGPKHVLAKPFTRSALLEQIIEGLGLGQNTYAHSSRVEAIPDPPPNTRVLLVEDHPINQEVGVGILEGSDITVVVAANGERALAALEEQEFDLVLMDVQMPVMDGWEATRQIRAQKRFDNLPVLAMTADVLVEDRAKCFEAGMDDYIAKPFSPSGLLVLVAKWATIARKSAQSAAETPGASASGRATWERREELVAPVARSASVSSAHIFRAPEWEAPAVDEELAMRILEGDRTIWIALLDGFDNELLQMERDLKGETDPPDPTAAARALHTLKGLAPTLGGQRLADVATRLERRVRANGTLAKEDQEAISVEIAAFREMSAKICAAEADRETPA